MKKKTAAMIISLIMCAAMLSGCGTDRMTGADALPVEEETASDAAESTAEQVPEETAQMQTADEAEAGVETEAGTETSGTSTEAADQADDNGRTGDQVTVRIGSLKGPTSIGLMYLMEQAENGETDDPYEFTMTAAADELLPAMLSGELDIALIPANMASVLYNKAEGDVAVIDINTLGVLYMVSGDDKIEAMEDLAGRTVYLTGKGTTPDYVLQYLLKENGLNSGDVTLEYKSEATEVAAVLAETPDAIGVLPQPFVTAACAQNKQLSVVMDLTEEWDAVQGAGGSRLVTGVTVVRKGFLADHQEMVDRFLEEHAVSAAYANEHVEETAELVVEAGIIEKAPVAVKAIPECNITYIDGEEMRMALEGYLAVLCGQDPASVGGGLPGDDFYYENEGALQ